MSHAMAPAPPPPPRLAAYIELVRLPNVFTAMADIFLGFLFTHAAFAPLGIFLLLVAASSCLYMAGMALNDFFDRDQDARERPGRPLPSGRIRPRSALRLGLALLAVGTVLGWGASLVTGNSKPAVVVTLLAAAVFAYDVGLKRTPLGPVGMGTCRALNVLLGMSAAQAAWHTVHWLVAAAIGTYIVGVTWYARTEARRSNRLQLALATAVFLLGIGLLAWFPAWADARLPEISQPVHTTAERWRLLMTMLGLLIGWRAVRGVMDPSPAHVQAAVRQCILSLIVLDASACFVVRGFEGAVPILLLLVPTLWLGRWLYST